MAVSKLFTPVISKTERRSDASYATEPNDQFMNVPIHADNRVFENPTDKGEAVNPLHLNGGAQPSPQKWEKRGKRSVPQEKFEY